LARFDLVFLHPPSVYDFRKRAISFGPISDLIPSTPVFEMYPVGFVSLLKYLRMRGFKVRIVNLASRMLRDPSFNVEAFIKGLDAEAFGLDLHWLVHAHGCLEIAKIIKKMHPDVPVILGGLSATYFHEELAKEFPQVDYIIRGDSGEVPLLHLMECIENGRLPEEVPNLTWRSGDGGIHVNPLSYVPESLEVFRLDYGEVVKSVVKSLDLTGHLPSEGWLEYPITAVLTCKGCAYNCITCGGSKSAYNLLCGRSKPAFKSPEKIVEEIKAIEQYLDAPIFLIGDLRQGGEDYAQEVLKHIKLADVSNPIIFELFTPVSRRYLEMMATACTPQNLEISPESHDERIRRFQGRPYSNWELERTISDALDLGFRKVDVFFMIGLARQTFESVMDTVKYCGSLLERFGREGRLHPFIAPLAPFLDPGSPAFEVPEKYGYERLYSTLTEHREALTAACWKFFLNYRTRWMSRDDIMEATYEAAYRLNDVKRRFNLITEEENVELRRRITLAREITEKVQKIIQSTKDPAEKEKALIRLKETMEEVNGELLCLKKELRVPSKARIKGSGILKALLGK